MSDLELCDLILARWKASNEAWRSQCERMLERQKKQVSEMFRLEVCALVCGFLSGMLTGVALALWWMR